MAPPLPSQSSSTTPTPSNFNGCFDPLDVDAYINYDQLRCSSPSVSPAAARSQVSRQATTSAMANTNNTLLPTSSSMVNGSFGAQTFSGPSYPYEMHKQTTGIPLGSLANTHAVNQLSNTNLLVRDQSGFGMSTDDSFFGTSPSVDEFLDFNSGSNHHPSVSTTSDMDMEFDGSTGEDLPAFFFPEKSTTAAPEFVNPNALGGQEQQSGPSRTAGVNTARRLYPGVHTQQQAAKARQQQLQQQQQQQQTAQKPSPLGRATVPHHSTDPVVEERISRLLNSMRQSSVAGSSEDDSMSNANGVPGHIARMRKEEEDMDEDERLLASEQGKKLSSKERRQLRNKVSARAFRSRRKEYIGQLEGEVAVKANEANDLRAENRLLREENTRLSDLTRMLLSSSAFSTFLDDLSLNGMRPPPSSTEPAPAAVAPPRPTENLQPNTRKDVNPAVAQQAQQQNTTQVGMTPLPDSTMDFSALDLDGGNAWALGNTGTGAWGNTTSQVFSVLDVPRGPAVDHIDSAALSGKTTHVTSDSFLPVDRKTDVPEVEEMPAVSAPKTQVDETVELDEADPAFALFADAATSSSTPPTEESSSLELFCGITPEKLFSRIELASVVEVSTDDGEVSSDSMDRFHRISTSIEAAMQRIERMTSHL